MEEQRHMTMPELRALRKRLGLNQEKVAELLGITQQKLSLYELKERSIPKHTQCVYEKLLVTFEQVEIAITKYRKHNAYKLRRIFGKNYKEKQS